MNNHLPTAIRLPLNGSIIVAVILGVLATAYEVVIAGYHIVAGYPNTWYQWIAFGFFCIGALTLIGVIAEDKN